MQDDGTPAASGRGQYNPPPLLSVPAEVPVFGNRYYFPRLNVLGREAKCSGTETEAIWLLQCLPRGVLAKCCKMNLSVGGRQVRRKRLI